MISITLNDGTILENLAVDGSYFVTSEKITPETLEQKLSPLTITDDTQDEHTTPPIAPGTYNNVKLAHFMTENDTYQFTLKVLSPSEVKDLKTAAQIAYLSMMSDIEIPE